MLRGIHSLFSSRLQYKEDVMQKTNRLLSLIQHGPHWKRRVEQFFYRCVCIRYRGNVSTEPLPSNDKKIFTEPLPSNDREIFTKPLPSNDRGVHIQTDWWERFLNYAVKMGWDAVIYIPSFMNIGSGIQKLMWYTHTCARADSNVIS
jgi:hypothetical protein